MPGAVDGNVGQLGADFDCGDLTFLEPGKRGPHQPPIESAPMVIRVNSVEWNLAPVYTELSLAGRRQT